MSEFTELRRYKKTVEENMEGGIYLTRKRWNMFTLAATVVPVVPTMDPHRSLPTFRISPNPLANICDLEKLIESETDAIPRDNLLNKGILRFTQLE